MALAFKTGTHFAERHVQRIVGKNGVSASGKSAFGQREAHASLRACKCACVHAYQDLSGCRCFRLRCEGFWEDGGGQ